MNVAVFVTHPLPVKEPSVATPVTSAGHLDGAAGGESPGAKRAPTEAAKTRGESCSSFCPCRDGPAEGQRENEIETTAWDGERAQVTECSAPVVVGCEETENDVTKKRTREARRLHAGQAGGEGVSVVSEGELPTVVWAFSKNRGRHEVQQDGSQACRQCCGLSGRFHTIKAC